MIDECPPPRRADRGHMTRVVIVTGAAGGIGSALVRHFEGLGDRVVGLDLVAGSDVVRVLDVRDAAACQTMCDQIATEHGRIDVLCNNAGTSAVGDVVSATSDDWDAAKPSVEFFAKLKAVSGHSSQEILYVGDRLDNDIAPALSAGLMTAWIRRGPWGFILDQRLAASISGAPTDPI